MYEAMGTLENQAEFASTNPAEVQRAMTYDPKPSSASMGKMIFSNLSELSK